MPVPSIYEETTPVSGTGALSVPWGTHNDTFTAILIVLSANETIATPTSADCTWTLITEAGTGTAGAAGSVRVAAFWARAVTGSMGNATVADTGDHQIARMLMLQNVVGTGEPINVTTAATVDTAQTGISISTVATTVANCLLFAISAGAIDSASFESTSGWVNTAVDGGAAAFGGWMQTTDGVGGGYVAALGEKASAGSCGTFTNDWNSATKQANIFFAISDTATTSGPEEVLPAPVTAGSAATPTPTITLGGVSLAVPASAAGSAATPTPTLSAASIVDVPAITAGSAATPTPTITLGGSSIAVPASAAGSAATSAPSYTLGGISLAVPAITAGSAATPTPTITLGGSSIAVPASTAGSAATPAPSYTLGGISLAVGASTAGSAATPTPTIDASRRVDMDAVTAGSAATPAPSYTLGGISLAVPASTAGSAATPTPTIDASQRVDVPAITAGSAATPTPTITLGGVSHGVSAITAGSAATPAPSYSLGTVLIDVSPASAGSPATPEPTIGLYAEGQIFMDPVSSGIPSTPIPYAVRVFPLVGLSITRGSSETPLNASLSSAMSASVDQAMSAILLD